MKTVVFKDGTYIEVKDGVTWEYEQDKNWLVTISPAPSKPFHNHIVEANEMIQGEGEIEKMDGKRLSAGAKERFEQLKHKEWDWRSFYNGWLEGRTNLIFKNKAS